MHINCNKNNLLLLERVERVPRHNRKILFKPLKLEDVAIFILQFRNLTVLL